MISGVKGSTLPAELKIDRLEVGISGGEKQRISLEFSAVIQAGHNGGTNQGSNSVVLKNGFYLQVEPKGLPEGLHIGGEQKKKKVFPKDFG